MFLRYICNRRRVCCFVLILVFIFVGFGLVGFFGSLGSFGKGGLLGLLFKFEMIERVVLIKRLKNKDLFLFDSLFIV